MGKLHEVIAVEKDLKNKADKIIKEAHATFSGRKEHFNESSRKYIPYDAEDRDLPDEEFIPMVTTVPAKLQYIQGDLIKLLDCMIQKESTNTKASSNLVVIDNNGSEHTIAENVPVTTLVQFETVLVRIRNDIYDIIPTLDPGKKWVKDDSRDNVWAADPIKRVRNKKIPTVYSCAKATKEHKEQFQILNLDKVVGEWTNSTWSGCLSPKQKSEIMSRLDQIIEGVKKARARANDINVEKINIGNSIFNYINDSIK